MQPENLLLDSIGNLRISDFGLSALPEQVRFWSHLSVDINTVERYSISWHINVCCLHTGCQPPSHDLWDP